jgi:hypothetical protein
MLPRAAAIELDGQQNQKHTDDTLYVVFNHAAGLAAAFNIQVGSVCIEKVTEMLFRLSVAFVFLKLLCLPALAVDGTNLPGYDYSKFLAPSAQTCMSTCGGDPRCVAYTWVKPGYQGPVGRCYLKRVEPAIVKDRCCDSGPRRFIFPSNLKAEIGVDRPGSDYKDFDVADAEECQAACGAEQDCRTWTFVIPTEKTRELTSVPHCWLKNELTKPYPNEDMISGVKFQRGPGTID